MRSLSKPAGYSTAQILLHWVIAALVIFQVLFGEEIVPAYRALSRGETASADDLLNANIHVYVGIAILALAVVRLILRFVHGVPPAPADESKVQKWIAAVVHVILYAVIFGMPLTGLAAWYLGIGEVAEIHEAAKPVIVIAVALHVLGALWQHFIAKSDVLTRMLKPRRRVA